MKGKYYLMTSYTERDNDNPTIFYELREYPNYYVNGYGVVKRLYNSGKWHVLKPRKDKYGYLRVSVCVEGKSYYPKVHRLVASVYCIDYYEMETVDHLNEIKTDNYWRNLQCLSRSDNLKKRHRLRKGGVKHK